MKTLLLRVRQSVGRVLTILGARRLLVKWRTWEHARFGEPEIHLLRYLVDPDRAAMDIGAADGVYVFHLDQLARRCIAFEPNPRSCSELKRDFPRVEVHQVAASAKEGSAVLRIPIVNGAAYTGWGTIEPKNQLTELPPHEVQQIEVRTQRPDQMSFDDIGFVKIDAEGHELEVLDGLSGILESCLPTLLIEIGGDQRGGSLADVRQRLDRLGYVALRLDERGVLRIVPKDHEVKGSLNVVFIPTQGNRAKSVS